MSSSEPRPITNSGDDPNIQSDTSTWCDVSSPRRLRSPTAPNTITNAYGAE